MHYVHAAELPINSIKFNRFDLNYSSNSSNSQNQLKNKPRKHDARQSQNAGKRPAQLVAHSNEVLRERTDLVERRRSEWRNEYADQSDRNDQEPNEQIHQASERRRRRRRKRTDFKQSNKKLKRNKFANNRLENDDWSDHQAFERRSGELVDGDRSSSSEIDNADPKRQRRRTSANKRNRSLLTNLVHQYTVLMQSQLLPVLFMSYNASSQLPSVGLSSLVASTSRPLTSSLADRPLRTAPQDLSSSANRDLIDSFSPADQPASVAFLFASNQSYDTSYVTFNSSYEPSYNSVLSPQRDWPVNRSDLYTSGRPDAYPDFTSPTTLNSSTTTSNFTSVPFFDMLNLNLMLTILISVIMIACILVTAIGNLFVIAAILRDRVLVGFVFLVSV